jgi:hypothetical protein
LNIGTQKRECLVELLGGKHAAAADPGTTGQGVIKPKADAVVGLAKTTVAGQGQFKALG